MGGLPPISSRPHPGGGALPPLPNQRQSLQEPSGLALVGMKKHKFTNRAEMRNTHQGQSRYRSTSRHRGTMMNSIDGGKDERVSINVQSKKLITSQERKPVNLSLY